MNNNSLRKPFFILKIFLHLFFILSLFYFYWFDLNKFLLSIEKYNIRFVVLASVFLVLLFFYLFFYYLTILKTDNKKNTIISWLYFYIFFTSLISYFFIFNSYCKFFLIISNITIVFISILFFYKNSYLIKLFKYSVERKMTYFLPVILLFLVINISMSIYTSFSISLEQSKYLFGVEIKDRWWQFFLLSLVNCLCSVIEETGDMNLIIIIALTTTINSILFFCSSLIFIESTTFTIKNTNRIYFTQININ